MCVAGGGSADIGSLLGLLPVGLYLVGGNHLTGEDEDAVASSGEASPSGVIGGQYRG